MSDNTHHLKMTVEQYLAVEKTAERRSEQAELELRSVGLQCTLTELYEDVDLDLV